MDTAPTSPQTVIAVAVAPARWTVDQVAALFDLPFNDLIYRAQTVHREHFDANAVQRSTLISIKTGGCPEDCGYCPQAARYHTGVDNEAMLSVDQVVAAAQCAKDNGATRFCMGAAWRGPKQRDLDKVVDMITAVRGLGMETCATLGMLKDGQAEQLKTAGLDYYNHNIDTAPEFYGEIVTTRTQQDRMDTLSRVRDAGMHVCSGGIVGMGETRRARGADRATGDYESVSRIGADQQSGAGGRHAIAWHGTTRLAGVCAHRGLRAHHHAQGNGAAVGGAAGNAGGHPGLVFSRRGEFDFLWR